MGNITESIALYSELTVALFATLADPIIGLIVFVVIGAIHLPTYGRRKQNQ